MRFDSCLAGFDGRWRGLKAAVIVFGMNVLCIQREERMGRREKRFWVSNEGVCLRREKRCCYEEKNNISNM